MYVGLAWALARGQALARRLRGALDGAAGVEVLTPARAMATIVAFRLTGWPAGAAADELRRRVFAIIGRVDEPAALRVSVAWFNTEDEIDRFAAATVELARYTPGRFRAVQRSSFND
jgi:selenocysteine lyase/cysteine desulfurase